MTILLHTAWICLIVQPGASRLGPEKVLLDADRAFAKAAFEKGIDGWMSFMAEDAARSPRIGDPFTTGKDAIRKLDAKMFADASVKLTWEPRHAHLYADGSSGITTGEYVVVKTANGEKQEVGRGHYVTWWRKEADGAWKVIFDTGTPEAVKK